MHHLAPETGVFPARTPRTALTTWSRDHDSEPEVCGEWIIGPDAATGNGVDDEWVIGPDAATGSAIATAEILAPIDRKYLSASSANASRSSLEDPVFVVWARLVRT